MNAKDLVKELTHQLGLPDSGFEGTGGCTLVFDKKIEINIEADDRKLHLFSEIAKTPAESSSDLYQFLLETHLLGYGTKDAYFGVNSASGQILLFHTFDLDHTDYTSFYNAVETFVNSVETWQKRLATFSADAPASGNESGFIKV